MGSNSMRSSEWFETPVLGRGRSMSTGANNLLWVPRNSRQGSDSDTYVRNNNAWDRPSAAPRSLLYRPLEGSGRAQDRWSLFEDRVRTGPYGLNSFPSRPHSPIQILVLDNEMTQEINPRLRQFIQESPPRIRDQWRMQLTPNEEESRLSQEEQKKALKKLKKQVYNPSPKNKNKRWCLYYRDNASTNLNMKEEEKEDDGKACAVCLEDFDPKQEVLVTPCNHMFHEDCIVPWVKTNGQCPVCRFALGEQRRGRGEIPLPLNNNIANLRPNDLFPGDLISLIRGMEEAFQWLNR